MCEYADETGDFKDDVNFRGECTPEADRKATALILALALYPDEPFCVIGTQDIYWGKITQFVNNFSLPLDQSDTLAT